MYSVKDELLRIREKNYVRNNFDCRRDFDVDWCSAHMASQPAVGLLPEWRAWLDLFDSDHPVTYGQVVSGLIV